MKMFEDRNILNKKSRGESCAALTHIYSVGNF